MFAAFSPMLRRPIRLPLQLRSKRRAILNRATAADGVLDVKIFSVTLCPVPAAAAR
jgi:hypothetical protein